jgi:hypothetical protein
MPAAGVLLGVPVIGGVVVGQVLREIVARRQGRL